jgi:hypothetical protein
MPPLIFILMMRHRRARGAVRLLPAQHSRLDHNIRNWLVLSFPLLLLLGFLAQRFGFIR